VQTLIGGFRTCSNRVREERAISRPSSEQAVLFPDASVTERAAGRGASRSARSSSSRPLAVGLEDARNVVFLDVETTGLSWYYDDLTLVGWARNGAYKVHVAGDDPTDLLATLADARALVTFNGTLFDLKFLKKTFGEIPLPSVHIDLIPAP
jgi:uncharacterized protein YprB with RNaseH-like and TPR domain